MTHQLQALTRNLPEFVKDPLQALIGKKCYHSLVWNVDLSDTDCLKLSLSKALGLGLVLGGAIVKVPQIVKIVRARSARGVSLTSYLLDSASTLVYVAYNVRHAFPWSTYGETVFLLIQNAVIIALVAIYSTSSTVPLLALLTSAFVAAAYALATPSIVSSNLLKLLLSASIPLSCFSKLPQIITNYQNGSTGQLSAFLVFNSFLGTLARVFTTSAETGDSLLWWNYVLLSVLNGIIALQMLTSWNKSNSGMTLPSKRQLQSTSKKTKSTMANLTQKASSEAQEKAGSVAAALMDKQQGGGSRPGTPTSAKGSRTSSPASAKRYVRKLE
ncbi:hypothetical protein OIO90_001582 [Microbotryomycetes sp. JL221]|nr:hypothetical protein OIO90_001582 [Microbotryomycetes sp. JL221]